MDWLEHEEAPLDEPMLPPLPPRSPRRKASVVRESFNINEIRDDYVRASPLLGPDGSPPDSPRAPPTFANPRMARMSQTERQLMATFESLDHDACYDRSHAVAAAEEARADRASDDVASWATFGVIGVATGATAYAIGRAVEDGVVGLHHDLADDVGRLLGGHDQERVARVLAGDGLHVERGRHVQGHVALEFELEARQQGDGRAGEAGFSDRHVRRQADRLGEALVAASFRCHLPGRRQPAALQGTIDSGARISSDFLPWMRHVEPRRCDARGGAVSTVSIERDHVREKSG